MLETGLNSCLAFGSAATQCDFSRAALRACSSACAVAGLEDIAASTTATTSCPLLRG